MTTFRTARTRAIGGVLCIAAITSGCATLPSSGPTGHEIEQAAEPKNGPAPFDIVDLDADAVAKVEAQASAVAAGRPTLAGLARASDVDVIGVGDVLAISIYEVGVSLFGGGRVAAEGFDPSAKAEQFPLVPVERDGTIKLPFVGRIQAAGQTTAELQAMIERAYHGQSQHPQVMVAIKQNNSELAYVSGDVRRPGRLELTLEHQRLLDAIALAGGATAPSPDVVVRVTRGADAVEERLNDVRAGSPDDLVLVAGDRVEVINRPRSFVVLGASAKVAQVAFDQDSLSLAEAIARAGGPNDATADPTQIFLFRQGAGASSTRPVIYRLDLMRPASYLLAQRFAMRDKDVIYVSNARANRPTKLVAIINQLFAPFVSARVVAK